MDRSEFLAHLEINGLQSPLTLHNVYSATQHRMDAWIQKAKVSIVFYFDYSIQTGTHNCFIAEICSMMLHTHTSLQHTLPDNKKLEISSYTYMRT